MLVVPVRDLRRGGPTNACSVWGVPEHKASAAQADASVDAVVAFDAFHQLSSETDRIDTFVADVARVLKPGGVFVFFERGLLHVSICLVCRLRILRLCT